MLLPALLLFSAVAPVTPGTPVPSSTPVAPTVEGITPVLYPTTLEATTKAPVAPREAFAFDELRTLDDGADADDAGPLRLRPRSGIYARFFGGLGLLQDDDIEFDNGLGGLQSGDGEFDAGFMTGLAVGYRFNEHWSLEAEYAYRTNDVDTFDAGGMQLADGGDFASTSILVNLRYHFATDWRFDPYIGFGFGFADEIDIDLEGAGFNGEESFSGDSPAAQYIVGVESQLSSRWSVNVEGRFYRAFDPDMSGEGNLGNVESEYGHFGLLVGVTYAF